MLAFDAPRQQVVQFYVGVELLEDLHGLFRAGRGLTDRVHGGGGTSGVQDQRVRQVLGQELETVGRLRLHVVAWFLDVVDHGEQACPEPGSGIAVGRRFLREESLGNPVPGQIRGGLATLGFKAVEHGPVLVVGPP